MTCLPSEQAVESLTFQQDHLNIIFKNEWYQEDIPQLIDLIISPKMVIVIQENNQGADREDVRFSWCEHYFVLNFDYYSQSCWIEGQDIVSTEHLSELHSVII